MSTFNGILVDNGITQTPLQLPVQATFSGTKVTLKDVQQKIVVSELADITNANTKPLVNSFLEGCYQTAFRNKVEYYILDTDTLGFIHYGTVVDTVIVGGKCCGGNINTTYPTSLRQVMLSTPQYLIDTITSTDQILVFRNGIIQVHSSNPTNVYEYNVNLTTNQLTLAPNWPLEGADRLEIVFKVSAPSLFVQNITSTPVTLTTTVTSTNELLVFRNGVLMTSKSSATLPSEFTLNLSTMQFNVSSNWPLEGDDKIEVRKI